MTEKPALVTTISGVVVAAQNQTVAEVTGSSHQSGTVGFSSNGTGMTVGGGGSGEVSTKIVNVEKGSIERYSDGHDLNFSLRMDPFLRVGEDVALVRVRGVNIGAAKLKTGQWRVETLEFGDLHKVRRVHTFISLLCIAGAIISPFILQHFLGTLVAFVVVIASYVATNSRANEVKDENSKLITKAVQDAQKTWAERIGKGGVAAGEIRGGA